MVLFAFGIPDQVNLFVLSLSAMEKVYFLLFVVLLMQYDYLLFNPFSTSFFFFLQDL